MAKKSFDSILADAQKLMLNERFNSIVDSRSRSIAKGGGVPINDIKQLEEMAFGGGYGDSGDATMMMQESAPSQTIKTNEEIDFTSSQAQKLPKAILESFKKNPPMSGEGTILANAPTSSLDQISEKLKITPQKIQQTTNRVNESIISAPNTGGIDYSLIKSIIDESVSRHMKQMNESAGVTKFAGMKLCEGNKIQFVDSKGNLFEGQLKLKRRAKQ